MAIASETSQGKLFTLWILKTDKKKSDKNIVFVEVLLKFPARNQKVF